MARVKYLAHFVSGKEDNMLTEQEIINNALKEMAFMEDMTAQKFAQTSQQITTPNLHNILNAMEAAARNNMKSISQKMTEMSIV